MQEIKTLTKDEIRSLYKKIDEQRKDLAWREYIDNITFSYSNLLSFHNCKHCWFKKYALKIREETHNPFSDFGTLMHKIIEGLDNETLSREEAIEELTDNMKEINLPSYYGNDLNSSYYRQAYNFIENYNPPTRPLYTEKQVEFRIGRYKFKGFIDNITMINDKLYIIDHKSKGRFKSNKEKSEYARQLYLYSIPVIEQFDRYPEELIFNLFRTQELVRIEFKKEEFDNAKQWAIDTIEEIKNTREFTVTDNKYWKDNFCEFKNRQDHLDDKSLYLYNYEPTTYWKVDYERNKLEK